MFFEYAYSLCLLRAVLLGFARQGQVNAGTAQRTGNCAKTVQHARNTVCVADAQYNSCQYTVGVFVQILFAQDKTCRMRSGNALDLGQEIALT